MNATIWHHPRCAKSREALAILQDAGADLTIIDYLATPPSVATLSRLYARAGMFPHQGLRAAEPGAATLADADDAAVLEAMAANPVLIERPLVETEKGVVLARPPERVRALF